MTKAAELAKMGEVLTNSQIGGRRNIIINGAMQVAQRGTSSTSGGMSTVDRTKLSYSGGTVTQSQESLSSGTPYTQGFHKFYRATNTSVVTDTASHYRVFRQNIEDQNVAVSGWDYESTSSFITVSFWVRSSVSQEFYAHINQGVDAYNFVFSTGTLSANTWTKVTKTISGNSNLSFDNDNSAGIEFNIVPFWGTNFTTSSTATDTWYAWNGASRVPDMTSTWATTSGATFDITGLQMEVGSQATPFEHRSFGEELALCQRYFYQAVSGTAKAFGMGTYYATSLITMVLDFPTTMRAAPSVAVGTGSNYYVSYNNGQGDTFDTWDNIQRSGVNYVAMDVTGDGANGTAGDGCALATYNANAFINVDAEL